MNRARLCYLLSEISNQLRYDILREPSKVLYSKARQVPTAHLVIGVGISIRPNYDKGHTPEHLLQSVTMASRQKSPATDAQQPPGEEEVASGNGEGDEIMEEAEEQEDGYSE